MLSFALFIITLVIIWRLIKKPYGELDYKEKRYINQLAIKTGLLYFIPTFIGIFLIFNYPTTILISVSLIALTIIQLIVCPIYLYMGLKKPIVPDNFYNSAIGGMWVMILYIVIANILSFF